MTNLPYIAIPSYHRHSEQPTIKFLKEAGYSKELIFLFLNDQNEASRYYRWHNSVNEIVVSNTKGIVAARNFILDYFGSGKSVVMLDDDILGFLELRGKKTMTLKPSSFNALIKRGFSLLSIYGASLWGLYPVKNPYFMKRRTAFGRYFIIGSFTGIKISNLRYDPVLRVKEDYDFVLQHCLQDGGVVRLDYIVGDCKHYSNTGGCCEVRKENPVVEAEAVKYLLKKWPRYLRQNPKRKNEVLIH